MPSPNQLTRVEVVGVSRFPANTSEFHALHRVVGSAPGIGPRPHGLLAQREEPTHGQGRPLGAH